MKKHPLSALVFDFDLYPRGSVDSQHVREIASAMEAGAEMPPIVIDKASRRIVDGFHRCRAYLRLHGPDHKVNCIEKTYKDEKELFLDTMRYNASHGRALTSHDKAHCLVLAKRFEIEHELVAGALNLTSERAGALVSSRVGSVSGAPVALKQTIKHMAGKSLTPKQSEANNKLSGMNQLFYVNQLITLIESGLIDDENEDLAAGLDKLFGLLQSRAGRSAAA